MEESMSVQIGTGLIVIGALALFATVTVFRLPLIVLSLAVLALASGTILVGTSDIGPGESPV